jgi:hypothetical protein
MACTNLLVILMGALVLSLEPGAVERVEEKLVFLVSRAAHFSSVFLSLIGRT